MRRGTSLLSFIMAVILIVAMAATLASAEDLLNVKGKIVEYDLDARTLVVNTDEGVQMTFSVENDRAMKKLDDRLFVGDEVKIKYSVKDGKNVISGSNDLKGTKPGC